MLCSIQEAVGIFFFFLLKTLEMVLGGKRRIQGERRANLAAPVSSLCSAFGWDE